MVELHGGRVLIDRPVARVVVKVRYAPFVTVTHGGYVKRMKAAVTAVSGGEANLEIVLCQIVHILRGGEPVRMSKRAGSFVTLRELIEEVGRDAVRFTITVEDLDLPSTDLQMNVAVPGADGPTPVDLGSIARHGSTTVTGSLAWLTVEPEVPTVSSDGELVGPASKIRPEMLTPLTSATFMVTLPAVGISVGKPSPMIFVSALVTLIVEA